MVKIWLVLALSTVAFGDSITYDYTGNPLIYCNGVTFVNGNCPADYASDYVTMSLTFSAPLADNLSSINEIPNLLSWSISDALGDASFSSSDADAASELTQLTLSTDGSGDIDQYTIDVSNIVNE